MPPIVTTSRDGLVVEIRSVSPAEYPLVADYWVRSYGSAPEAKRCPKDLYSHGMRERVRRLVCESPAKTLVAFVDGVAVGFVCAIPGGALHYVAVKAAYRRRGIAKRLLAASRCEQRYTHSQMPAAQWARQAGWEYSPREI